MAVQNPLMVSWHGEREQFHLSLHPACLSNVKERTWPPPLNVVSFDMLHVQIEGTEKLRPNGCKAQPEREFLHLGKIILERIFSSNKRLVIDCHQIKNILCPRSLSV